MIIYSLTHICTQCGHIETESQEADVFSDPTIVPQHGWADLPSNDIHGVDRYLCPACVEKLSIPAADIYFRV